MKTVDLRTYLLLERAFVRRLQRSWRQQSAPIYEQITEACINHRWDEARRLVPTLDMTEVGTQNREWITYMLLSCAAFGATTVSKSKPSFVGVGSFDTFLKQVTNNFLQYLEYNATAQVQAEAMQSIAEDEAKTKGQWKVAAEVVTIKFDESKVQREPAGAPGGTGGQFTETGHTGAISHPVLKTQAEAGIKAVEKLLPTAIREADYDDVPGPDNWYDLSGDVQSQVHEKYIDASYSEGIDIDESELFADAKSELRSDNDDVLDEAWKETKEILAHKFFDPDPTLPLEGEQQFQLKRTLDPERLEYVEFGDDEDGIVSLDVEALRFTDGRTLTPEDKEVVIQTWNTQYELAFEEALQKHLESDEYQEKRNELETEAISDRWDSMSDYEKFDLLQEYGIHPSGKSKGQGEPDTWVTGVTEGTHTNEDYARTHAVALKLAELRTDELRKERGLLGPKERPTYTIEPGKHDPTHFVIKDKHGKTIGSSNTEEQAKNNAEQWADDEMRRDNLTSGFVIDRVWSAWKQKSSEGLGLSLQLAAARELGGHHRMTEDEVAEAEAHAETYGGMDTLQAYVRAQWETTQMVMQKAGETSVSVYRGLMLPGKAVDQTESILLDKNGQSIAPPTNVEEIQGKHSNPHVAFDYAGEHFVVEKQRIPAASIKELGAQSWAMQGPDIHVAVQAEWMKDAMKVYEEDDEIGLGTKDIPPERRVELAQGMFERMSKDAKLDLMNTYAAQGRLGPLVKPIPIRPYESNEAAMKRRIDDYMQSHPRAFFIQLPNLTLKRAGAQSTTGTASVANEWGGVGNLPEHPQRVVLRIEAPATSVLSLPVYGQNEQAEHETVIMGTRDRWLWEAWKNRAPEFEMMPIARKAETTPLEIDLQAEDRGKPHWMSGVDWMTVEKWDESQHPRDEDGQFTRVAMTSQRGEGDPGHQTNKEVFEHMRTFAEGLKALPGVSHVSVKPGVGGWDGGSESMWQIYYRGNGEARKLVAATAKRFNQDAVLMLKGCKVKAECQPSTELSFAAGLNAKTREAVHAILVANGIGGWTWMKRDGKTVLRMVSVPQWGSEAKTHQQATAVVSKLLRERGLENHRRVHRVAVSVMEREGENSYDNALNS